MYLKNNMTLQKLEFHNIIIMIFFFLIIIEVEHQKEFLMSEDSYYLEVSILIWVAF